MEGHILRRPFGVYAAFPEEGTIDIMYQVLGFGTDHMTHLEPGERVEAIGPVGRGWQPPAGCKKALLVAGGVGSAPIHPLVGQLKAQGAEVTAILGAQTAEALVARQRFAEALGCEPLCSTDDGTFGRAGFCTPLVQEALDEAAASGQPFDYVACCGPEPLMKLVASMAEGAGVFCEVSLERRMACGVGACLSCVVDTRGRQDARSCVDGPVFRREGCGVVMPENRVQHPSTGSQPGRSDYAQPRDGRLGNLRARAREYCPVRATWSRMGAVTTKGVSLNGWEGNDSPRISRNCLRGC